MKDIRIAAAYIRVSTEDQTEFSPAAQLRELQEYASSNSMILSSNHIYTDEGISGRKAEKRPGFMKMIADAKAKPRPFDVILVHKFDRFARSREDSIVYKSMLKRVGVEVISIKEPLAEGSYSGVMEAIYESFAEAYSINLGQEVKKGMREKALRGELQSTPSFGYTVKNNVLFPQPPEDDIVREIFHRYNSGDSLISIASDLNSRGIRTHRGNPFENRTLQYILRNPVYIGKLRWNPTGRTRRDFSNENIILSDAPHAALIDIDTWAVAQKRLDESSLRHRWHGRPSYDRKHWLSGIVRCSTCEATLIFSKPHYFKCSNYARGRCKTSQHIKIDLLEQAVISQLQEDMLVGNTIRYQEVRRSSTERHSQQTVLGKIELSEKKKARLTDAYLSGVMDLEDYSRLKAVLEQELSELRAAQSTEEETKPETALQILRSQIEQALRTIVSDKATTEEKYNAANSIVDRCVFDKSTMSLSIIYRLSI